MGRELPYLVIIIDEFAISFWSKTAGHRKPHMSPSGQSEGLWNPLGHRHQRPSVDVITGLIKANFPTRVSFRVSAGQDSRTILNTIGAEKLLGRGDMLYKHGIEMRRLHAAFINEEKICDLIDKISTDVPPFLEKA